MASKTNIEKTLCIQSGAEKSVIEKLDGKSYRVTHATRRGNSRFYFSDNVQIVKSRAAACRLALSLVNPITAALFNGLCMNHTGKMTDVISFSTYCGLNPRCIERMKDGNSVCAACFAARQMKRQKSTREKLIKNTELITATVYSPALFPIIPGDMFRLEAFGDLINDIQAVNYISWSAVNNHALVALWTKNPDILWKGFEKIGFNKPKNLNVIFSSPRLNSPADNMRKLYIMPDGKPMIDKIFTVYTKKYIQDNNIVANCGARSCRGCKRCYKKSTGVYVREILK